MSKSLNLGLWLRAAVVGAALAALQGHAEAEAIPDDEQISWDSPKMGEIEKEWRSLQATYDKTPEKIPGGGGKDQYFRFSQLQHDLLSKRLSDRELRQLAGAPGPIPDGAFTDNVVDLIVWTLVEIGDRDRLVTLLSKRCTGRVYGETVEYCLAFRGYKLKDPILVLGEAYSKCQSPETCHNLAAAVRRGFSGHGIHCKDDAGYVKSGMQWYEKEKDGLEVNADYARNDADSTLAKYERNPKLYEEFPPPSKREQLFEKKVSVERSPSGIQESEHVQSKPMADDIKRATSTTAQKELAKLEGTWEIVEGAWDGQPIPQERTRNNRVVIRNEMLQWKRINPDGEKEEDEFHVLLNVQQRPFAIDLKEMPRWAIEKGQTTPLVYELQEQTTLGIYDLEGDTLRICLSLPQARHRPTSFTTEKGSRDFSYSLKRAKE
jgi:uncharacterized protein (TIGR03067 family)